MTITTDIHKAYLWRDVVRLGFCPSKDIERKKWILCYCKNLKKFLGLEECPLNPTGLNPISGNVTIQDLDLCFDYSIFDKSKFNISFLHYPNQRSGFLWKHDVDDQYFSFPEQDFLTKVNQRNAAVKVVQNNNMEAVIDGLICHPRVHQHIRSPIDEHYIRIGGGIDNPYLFLFHLRYQLCPSLEKRQEERQRLVNLFIRAIKENSRVSAADLMGLNGC